MICDKMWKVSDKDIVCYKQLWRGSVLGFLYTPLIRRRIFPWVLSGKVLYRARGCEEVETLGDLSYWVNGGFVYSYADSRHVISDGVCNVAYECVILAGARYWVSADGSTYASECLRFVRKM